MAAAKSAPKKLVLSKRQKVIIASSAAALLLAIGGWWSYMTFTTMPPPNISTAKAEEVAEFVGSSRGLARMSIDNREQFLYQAYSQYADGERRTVLNRALREMSPAQQQVFTEAVVEVAKTRFLEKAKEYNKLSPGQRLTFVDGHIREFEGMRQKLAGVSAQDNIGAPMQKSVPTTSDGLARAIVDRTNARQRAQAMPLFDAVAARYNEIQKSAGLKTQFQRGG